MRMCMNCRFLWTRTDFHWHFLSQVFFVPTYGGSSLCIIALPLENAGLSCLPASLYASSLRKSGIQQPCPPTGIPRYLAGQPGTSEPLRPPQPSITSCWHVAVQLNDTCCCSSLSGVQISGIGSPVLWLLVPALRGERSFWVINRHLAGSTCRSASRIKTAGRENGNIVKQKSLWQVGGVLAK